MTLIEWDEKFSVGVASIDEQHKKLIGIINLINDAVELGFNKNILIGIFEELVTYTKVHFKYEEGLLDKTKYTDYKNHSNTHRQFENQLSVFQSQFSEQEKDVSKPLIIFLKNWLKSHIMGVDKEYTDHLLSNHIE